MKGTCGAMTRKRTPCTKPALPLLRRCWQHTLLKHPLVPIVLTIAGLALGVCRTYLACSFRPLPERVATESNAPRIYGLTEEDIGRIVETALAHAGFGTSEREQNRQGTDDLRPELASGSERVASLARAGDQQAARALEVARKHGDVRPLGEVLKAEAERQGPDAPPELAREVRALGILGHMGVVCKRMRVGIQSDMNFCVLRRADGSCRIQIFWRVAPDQHFVKVLDTECRQDDQQGRSQPKLEGLQAEQ